MRRALARGGCAAERRPQNRDGWASASDEAGLRWRYAAQFGYLAKTKAHAFQIAGRLFFPLAMVKYHQIGKSFECKETGIDGTLSERNTALS